MSIKLSTDILYDLFERIERIVLEQHGQHGFNYVKLYVHV